MKRFKFITFFCIVTFILIGCGHKYNNDATSSNYDKANKDTDISMSLDNIVVDHQPYVVDFSATWCGPCRRLAPVYHEMASQLKGKAQLVSVDIDDEKDLADRLNIEAVPTVIVFEDSTMSNELYRVTGLDIEGIQNAIEKSIIQLNQ